MNDDLPDLSRTRDAIKAYDLVDSEFTTDRILSGEAPIDIPQKLEKLGEAVGIAYGLDTADRNSLETCKQYIRPGPANPPPGYDISFVRRMVRDWQNQERA